MSFYSNEVASGKISSWKLVNVWRPYFKSFPFNCYVSQNKTLTNKPSNTWKPFLHKLEISLQTCNNGEELFLTHLKFEAFNKLKASFPHTSNFKVETFKNLKNVLSHLRTYNNLKKSFPHLSLTWRHCMLLVCQHLEMDSHSFYNLVN
jgi:hypothetical protein